MLSITWKLSLGALCTVKLNVSIISTIVLIEQMVKISEE